MTVKVMNINDLAEKIANEFKKDMAEKEFETFKEMAECFWWDANDIRGEITWMQNDFINEEYDELVKEFGSWQSIPRVARCLAYDDGSIECGKEEMTYGQFKKLVLSKI